MVKRVGFGHKGRDEQDARSEKERGTNILNKPYPKLERTADVSADREMDQGGEENINMPGPHQQPKSLIDRFLVREIGAHILARDEKNDEEYGTEADVSDPHRP